MSTDSLAICNNKDTASDCSEISSDSNETKTEKQIFTSFFNSFLVAVFILFPLFILLHLTGKKSTLAKKIRIFFIGSSHPINQGYDEFPSENENENDNGKENENDNRKVSLNLNLNESSNNFDEKEEKNKNKNSIFDNEIDIEINTKKLSNSHINKLGGSNNMNDFNDIENDIQESLTHGTHDDPTVMIGCNI